jgi:hypothetical protein
VIQKSEAEEGKKTIRKGNHTINKCRQQHIPAWQSEPKNPGGQKHEN